MTAEIEQTANALRTAAIDSKAWPYEEARKLLKRYPDGAPAKGHVLFETGYGPSGLPHIGTFTEVLRTTMVRRAFETACARCRTMFPTRRCWRNISASH